MVERAEKLFGRNHAVEVLRMFIERPDADGMPQSRVQPVLVFEGMRGGGKSALLASLSSALDQQAPYATVDFEAIDGSTDVPEVLSGVAFQLGRRCGPYGMLDCPRLTAGLEVMRQDLDLGNRARAAAKVIEVLGRSRNVDAIRAILKDTGTAALGVVQTHTGVPVAGLGKYTDLLVNRITARQGGRRIVLGAYQDWYGHRGRGWKNNPIDVLVDLNRWAGNRDSEDNRSRLSELLWDAFLTDLREGFTTSRHPDELSLNCVVLLDNIDTELGRRFVTELADVQRGLLDDGGFAPVPLTVAATSRGEILANAAVASVVDCSELSWQPARGQAWSWCRCRLPDLTQEQIGAMLSMQALQGGNNSQLKAMIGSLTGGHPASVRLLLDAVAHDPSAWREPAAILDRQEPGTGPGLQTVERKMLQGLLGRLPEAGESYDDLVTCSAAFERRHALSLFADECALLSGNLVTFGADVDRLLWSDTPDAAPSVLRRLLLRSLAMRGPGLPPDVDGAQDADAGSTAWTAVFTALRDHCRADDAENRPDPAGESVAALYYTLALGDLASVARQLGSDLGADDCGLWLERLEAVTSAPRRRRRPDAPLLTPTEQMRALLHQAGRQTPSVEPVMRLVAARWVVSDPFVGSRRRSLHLQISADLTELVRQKPNDAEPLLMAARHHRRQAELWD